MRVFWQNFGLGEVLTLIMLLMACRPDTAVPTPTATPGTAATTTAVPPTVTPVPPEIEPLPTASATATAVPSPLPFQLGDPLTLGRGRIVDAAFTPDGTAVAIAWAGGVSLATITGQEMWWQPFEVPVIALDVHPDGEAVAVARGDGRVTVIEVATGDWRQFDDARPNAYWGDIAWSPAGQQIAFQFIGPGRGDPIYLLDAESGALTEVPESRIDSGTRPYLVWSSDGQAINLAALGSRCGQVLDIESGESLFTLEAEDGCFTSHAVTWSPDGRLLALYTDNRIVLAEWPGGEPVQTITGSVLAFSDLNSGRPLFFSPDGQWLASKGGIGFYNDTLPLIVWNTMTGQPAAQLGESGKAYDLGFTNKNRIVSAFDGESLLSLYENGEITRWAFASEQAEEEIIGRVPVVVAQANFVWSADGRILAVPNLGGGTAVWNVATAQLETLFDAPLTAPALNPDGNIIVLLDPEQEELNIVDLNTSETLLTLPDAALLPGGAAFSPDGLEIVYGSQNRVVVADVATGEPSAILTGPPGDQLLAHVIWSPDGDAFVTASGEPFNSSALGPLILWQRTTEGAFAEVFRTETVHGGYDCCVHLALFNPAGSLVALEQMPALEAVQLKLLVYDRDAGKVILSLDEYQLAAWISNDELLAAEAQYDTRLTRWHVRTGESTVVSGRESGVNVYAPGGMVYADLSTSRGIIGRAIEIREWDAGRVLAQVTHGSDIIQIEWSPDGSWLASLAADGTIKVWPLTGESIKE